MLPHFFATKSVFHTLYKQKGGSAMPDTDSLIKDFSENYLEKLFYFCLKRCGDVHTAEDLAQDISLNVIISLKRGAKPLNFPAYVWQIARNRYSRLIFKKSDTDSIFSAEKAFDVSPEEDIIRMEERSALRRALAYIASDYRRIIVAYYIEEKSVKDIAVSLGLPEGTVKSKLHRARNILKEGMDMAKEFGPKSYNPEKVSFISTGNQPTGYPWKAISRSIPKNILLEASDNPSTAEELALALGVALPYMEEEIALLIDAALLKKTGNKYVTDFFIANAETQLKVRKMLLSESKERSYIIDKIVTDTLPEVKQLGLVREHMKDSDFKWWLVLNLCDHFRWRIEAFSEVPKERSNGESWGLIGFEDAHIEQSFVGNNNLGAGGIQFGIYDIHEYGLSDEERIPPTGKKAMDHMVHKDIHALSILADILRRDRKIGSLSETEMISWEHIKGWLAHENEDGGVTPDIIVVRNGDYDKLFSIFAAHPDYDTGQKRVQTDFDNIVSILSRTESHALHQNLNFYASMLFNSLREMTMHDLVESGGLIVPDDPQHSTLGMYLEI